MTSKTSKGKGKKAANVKAKKAKKAKAKKAAKAKAAIPVQGMPNGELDAIDTAWKKLELAHKNRRATTEEVAQAEKELQVAMNVMNSSPFTDTRAEPYRMDGRADCTLHALYGKYCQVRRPGFVIQDDDQAELDELLRKLTKLVIPDYYETVVDYDDEASSEPDPSDESDKSDASSNKTPTRTLRPRKLLPEYVDDKIYEKWFGDADEYLEDEEAGRL